MVHYLDSNEKVWELSQSNGLILPSYKIGDTVTLKENWIDVYINLMMEKYFPERNTSRTDSLYQPPPDTIEKYKPGFKYIITNKFIAVNHGIAENVWWSGIWPTHEGHEPQYFPDDCFVSINDITKMYKPKKFIYESFKEFIKQIK